MLHDVESERCLSHGGPRRKDDKIAFLEARSLLIEIWEPTGNAGYGTALAMEFFNPLHRWPDQFFDPDEFLGAAELDHLKNTLLGAIEQFDRGAVTFIDLLDDARSRFDQAPQDRLVADDLGVVVHVRGGGHHVDQGRDVLHPARAVEIAAAGQLVPQRHGVDDVGALREGDHRPEQQAMALPVEHRVVQDFGGLEGRVLVEQHRTQDRLLRLVAPRSLAAGELGGALSCRGYGGRCGRHPRSVASSWGCAAGRPGDT